MPADPADLYFGPYEFWNFGPGRGYAFPILRRKLNYLTALADLPRGDSGPAPIIKARRRHRTWVPTLWQCPELTFLPFVVARPIHQLSGPEDLHEALQDGVEQACAGLSGPRAAPASARFRVAYPVADAAMNPEIEFRPSEPSWQPDPDLRKRIGKGKRVTILAVIDDGIPFAHRHFRDKSGRRTRVEFCWLQSAAAEKDQESVLFGREYTRSQIEGFVADYGADEDRLYREAGAISDTEGLDSLMQRNGTHGAHVMDLAAGYAEERDEEPAEEIRIIAVQLPTTIAIDTSGFGKDMYMLSALHYIFHRADMIAQGYGIDRPRLVVNFSYGITAGRHDGETELEAAIHELVGLRRKHKGPTALVLPAGNTFLERLHGVIREQSFDAKGTASFHWRLQPNDRTPSYLEIWFSKNFNPSGYKVELKDPSGRSRLSLEIGAEETGSGDPRTIRPLLNERGEQIGQVSADLHRGSRRHSDRENLGRWRVLVVMAPSEPEDDDLPGIEAGKWTIVIGRGPQAKSLADNPIHCWIQRDTDPEALRSGSRQSYFEDDDDVRYGDDGALSEEDVAFPSEAGKPHPFIRRFGSFNGLATGATSLVVGGYRLGAGLGSTIASALPAHYSSAGVTEQQQWPVGQVACSSLSDRSDVLPGTVAAGVRSGSRSFVQGTSSAAPFVARRLATLFVTADDDRVEAAENGNYLSLLSDDAALGMQAEPKGGMGRAELGDEPVAMDERATRLGAVLVEPHWQPGIQR